MIKRFKERCRQILMGLCEENPVEATYLGFHSFDALLPIADRVSRGLYRYQKEQFVQGLKEFEDRKDELSKDLQIDLVLLKSFLEAKLYEEQVFRLSERRSDLYPTNALDGIYVLAMRDYISQRKRSESILNRLYEIPRYLDEGIENIRSGYNIPNVWTENGLEVTRRGIEFFEVLVPRLAETFPDKKDLLLEANTDACKAFRKYELFLKRDVMSKSIGTYAIGKESFNFLLKKIHHLHYTAEDLQHIGEKMIVSIKKHLEKHAKRIERNKDWREIASDLKSNHPDSDGLLQAYRDEMEKVKEFIRVNQIVTIPDNQTLLVRETPPFQRLTIPYAAFVPPAAFDSKQEGLLWITPVDKRANRRQHDEQLRGHCSWNIPITALHEGFPGHHLQLSLSHTHKSFVRRQITTPVFIEGWALYCEEMMKEAGFINDPRMVLMQLRDQLWRAVRIIIDVGLHCFNMKIGEAVNLLVEEVGMEKSHAIAEVKRYTMNPTQPMSYMIGKLEIMKFRSEMEKIEGERFHLRWFHDELLNHGSIPVSMIREEILEEIKQEKKAKKTTP